MSSTVPKITIRCMICGGKAVLNWDYSPIGIDPRVAMFICTKVTCKRETYKYLSKDMYDRVNKIRFGALN